MNKVTDINIKEVEPRKNSEPKNSNSFTSQQQHERAEEGIAQLLQRCRNHAMSRAPYGFVTLLGCVFGVSIRLYGELRKDKENSKGGFKVGDSPSFRNSQILQNSAEILKNLTSLYEKSKFASLLQRQTILTSF